MFLKCNNTVNKIRYSILYCNSAANYIILNETASYNLLDVINPSMESVIYAAAQLHLHCRFSTAAAVRATIEARTHPAFCKKKKKNLLQSPC